MSQPSMAERASSPAGSVPEAAPSVRRWGILAAVAFMTQLDVFIVNVTVPSIRASYPGPGCRRSRGWVRQIGAADCINYRQEDISAACARLCPDGVDVIFDNVGGTTLDALLPHLADDARVVLCGAISRYDGDAPAPLRNWFYLLPRRARMEGFIYIDHQDRFDEIEADLLPRLRKGELRSREHVVEGLTAAPAALQMLFEGRNTGKLLVRVDHS